MHIILRCIAMFLHNIKQQLPRAKIEKHKCQHELVDSSFGLNFRVLSFSSVHILHLVLFCGKMLKLLHKRKNQAPILHLYPRKAMVVMGLGMQIENHLNDRFQSILIWSNLGGCKFSLRLVSTIILSSGCCMCFSLTIVQGRLQATWMSVSA